MGKQPQDDRQRDCEPRLRTSPNAISIAAAVGRQVATSLPVCPFMAKRKLSPFHLKSASNPHRQQGVVHLSRGAGEVRASVRTVPESRSASLAQGASSVSLLRQSAGAAVVHGDVSYLSGQDSWAGTPWKNGCICVVKRPGWNHVVVGHLARGVHRDLLERDRAAAAHVRNGRSR